MTDPTIAKLLDKLDVLIALTAVAALGGKTRREQIEALGRAGLTPKRIAEILDTSPNAVSVTLFQLKRKRRSSLGKKHKD